jgi:hypothetical protein
MYAFDQIVFGLTFAATFMGMTFRPKLFTEKAPMVPLIKAIAAKRSKDGVFSVENPGTDATCGTCAAAQIAASVQRSFP